MMVSDRRVELRIVVSVKPMTRKGSNWLWNKQPFTSGGRRRRQERQRKQGGTK